MYDVDFCERGDHAYRSKTTSLTTRSLVADHRNLISSYCVPIIRPVHMCRIELAAGPAGSVPVLRTSTSDEQAEISR